MSGMVTMGTRKLWTCWQGTQHWNAELPLIIIIIIHNKKTARIDILYWGHLFSHKTFLHQTIVAATNYVWHARFCHSSQARVLIFFVPVQCRSALTTGWDLFHTWHCDRDVYTPVHKNVPVRIWGHSKSAKPYRIFFYDSCMLLITNTCCMDL